MSRIAAIEVLPLRISPKTVWTFLKVSDSDGRIGTGEATLGGREAEVAAAALRGSLVGTSAVPADLARPVVGGDLPEAAVASALDQALWDLAGQRAGKPVWQLLGPTRRTRIPLYANINRRTIDRRPDGFAASTHHALAAGFTRFKVAPFDDLSPAVADSDDGQRLIDAGIARVAAVREAGGPSARVMVDCHWRFTEAAAGRAIDRLAELGVTWFECPIPETAETIPALARLRAHANRRGMQHAGLEMSPSPAALLPFLDGGCYDVVMPDIKYVGGFRGMLAAGALCAARGVGCAPHNPTGPICHAASVHAAAVLDGFDLLEHQYDESPLFDGLVSAGLPDHAGDASGLPAAPGLGVALDPALIAELRT
jgi:galactonate dehydratase